MKRMTLDGQRFFRLTVIRRIDDGERRGKWLVRCDCGNERAVVTAKLINGHTKSCGCLQRDITAARATHGMRRSPEYAIWCAMRSRCSNPRDKDYRYYGARGITVCDRWARFQNFISDVGRRNDPTLEIDRIDNCRGYEPGNVRWATKMEQANNKSSNRIIEHDGDLMTVAEAARRAGMPYETFRRRLL